MANVAKQAILRAKLSGVLTDLMVKTVTDNVYVNDTTTLTTYLATLATTQELENAIAALGALAGKSEVTYNDLATALKTLIDGKAEGSALTALTTRVTTAEGKITTLIGSDSNKSVRTIAAEELAKQLIADGADTSLDTLAEIAAWIQEHPDDAATMNYDIGVLKTQLSGFASSENVKAYVDDLIAGLNIGDYAKASELSALVLDVERLVEDMERLGELAYKDTVTEDVLAADLLEKINAASEGNHNHSNKTVLDGITSTKVSNWDSAYSNRHTHSNKTILDGISAANVAAWDGKANIFYASTEPSGMTDGDLWVQLVEE